jgi:cytochrome c peroxidase
MALVADLPPSPGNRFADDLDAANLGFAIFYDARFSSTNNLPCAGCHSPEKTFMDGAPTATGVSTGPRNTPTVLDAARGRWLFWDGRADTVWSQPLFPLESPGEMGFTRLGVTHRIALTYTALYTKVFGALPPLDDATRFPAQGMPGQPAWDAMAPADQDAVDQIFVNVGKSLEAFERHVVSGASPFDTFLGGDDGAISAGAKRGAALFFSAGCVACHSGPRFTDGEFHALGMPDADPQSARGRARGLELLAASEFNAQSRWYDGPNPPAIPSPTPADEGAFRTPSLRNVAETGPWGHDGGFATLEDAIRFHLQGGVGAVDPLLVPHDLGAGEIADLVAFLGALTGVGPSPPWDYWPAR